MFRSTGLAHHVQGPGLHPSTPKKKKHGAKNEQLVKLNAYRRLENWHFLSLGSVEPGSDLVRKMSGRAGDLAQWLVRVLA